MTKTSVWKRNFRNIKWKEVFWRQHKNVCIISSGWTRLDYPDSLGVFKNTH